MGRHLFLWDCLARHMLQILDTTLLMPPRACQADRHTDFMTCCSPQLSRPFNQRNVSVCYAPNGDQVDLKKQAVTTRPMNRQLQRRLQRSACL